MLSKYFSFVTFAVALMAIGFAANVQAEVLFTDSFNTATVPTALNDYCLNTDLVSRQAGSSLLTSNPTGVQWARHTPGTWTQVANTQQVNSAILGAANMMVTYLSSDRGTKDGASLNYQAAIIQHDFASDLSGKAFTVRWDTDPLSSGTPTSQGRVAGTYVFVGSNYPNGGEGGWHNTGLGFVDTSNDVCVYIVDNGTAYVQQGTRTLWTASTIFDSSAGTTGSSIVRAYTFELRVSTFAPSTPAVASLWWGMQGTPSESLVQVAIGSDSMPGMSDGKSLAYTWDANTVNYIGVGGAASVTEARSTIDNVSVTVIPEPSTLALLATGLVGLLAYAWRKRK